APAFDIELRADAPDDFRLAAFGRKHPAQKEEIPGLHRFDVAAERLRRLRKLDAELFQPLLSAGLSLFRRGIHSSTSPVPGVRHDPSSTLVAAKRMISAVGGNPASMKG